MSVNFLCRLSALVCMCQPDSPYSNRCHPDSPYSNGCHPDRAYSKYCHPDRTQWRGISLFDWQ